MTAHELIECVEKAGGTLTPNGDRLKYQLPQEVEPLLPQLRQMKDNVLTVLRQRNSVPVLPAGVTIIEWNPKQAPIEPAGV